MKWKFWGNNSTKCDLIQKEINNNVDVVLDNIKKRYLKANFNSIYQIKDVNCINVNDCSVNYSLYDLFKYHNLEVEVPYTSDRYYLYVSHNYLILRPESQNPDINITSRKLNFLSLYNNTGDIYSQLLNKIQMRTHIDNRWIDFSEPLIIIIDQLLNERVFSIILKDYTEKIEQQISNKLSSLNDMNNKLNTLVK